MNKTGKDRKRNRVGKVLLLQTGILKKIVIFCEKVFVVISLLGCHNKVSQTGCVNNRNLFSQNSGR